MRDKLASALEQTLEQNASDFDIPYLALRCENQGIVHVVGLEWGFNKHEVYELHEL